MTVSPSYLLSSLLVFALLGRQMASAAPVQSSQASNGGRNYSAGTICRAFPTIGAKALALLGLTATVSTFCLMASVIMKRRSQRIESAKILAECAPLAREAAPSSYGAVVEDNSTSETSSISSASLIRESSMFRDNLDIPDRNSSGGLSAPSCRTRASSVTLFDDNTMHEAMTSSVISVDASAHQQLEIRAAALIKENQRLYGQLENSAAQYAESIRVNEQRLLASALENATVTQRYKELSVLVNTHDQTIESLTMQVEQQQSEIRDLQKEKEEFSREYDALMIQYRYLKTENVKLRTANKEAEARAVEATDKVASTERIAVEVESQLDAAVTKATKANTRAILAEATLSATKRQVAQREAETAACEVKLAEAERDLTLVRKALLAKHTSYTTIQEKCTTLKAKYAVLEEKHAALEEEHTALTQEYTALDGEAAELAQWKEEYQWQMDMMKGSYNVLKYEHRRAIFNEKFMQIDMKLAESSRRDATFRLKTAEEDVFFFKRINAEQLERINQLVNANKLSLQDIQATRAECEDKINRSAESSYELAQNFLRELPKYILLISVGETDYCLRRMTATIEERKAWLSNERKQIELVRKYSSHNTVEATATTPEDDNVNDKADTILASTQAPQHISPLLSDNEEAPVPLDAYQVQRANVDLLDRVAQLEEEKAKQIRYIAALDVDFDAEERAWEERTYQQVQYYHQQIANLMQIAPTANPQDLLSEMSKVADIARSWLKEADLKRPSGTRAYNVDDFEASVIDVPEADAANASKRCDDPAGKVDVPASAGDDEVCDVNPSSRMVSWQSVEMELFGFITPAHDQYNGPVTPTTFVVDDPSESQMHAENEENDDEDEELLKTPPLTEVELANLNPFLDSYNLAGDVAKIWSVTDTPTSEVWDPSVGEWVPAIRTCDGDEAEQMDALTPSPSCHNICDPRRNDLYACMREATYAEGEMF